MNPSSNCFKTRGKHAGISVGVCVQQLCCSVSLEPQQRIQLICWMKFECVQGWRSSDGWVLFVWRAELNVEHGREVTFRINVSASWYFVCYKHMMQWKKRVNHLFSVDQTGWYDVAVCLCDSRDCSGHDLCDQPRHGDVLGDVSVDGHGDHGKHHRAVTVISELDI